MNRLAPPALLLLLACIGGRKDRPNAYAVPARDCQSAATLLAPGLEPTPAMAPQLWRVRACPARAGEILAQLLRDSRAISDTGRLESATWLTHFVHDAQLVTAGVDVAGDSLATPEARTAAFRVLLWSKAPGHRVSFRDMLNGVDCEPPWCRSTYTGHFFGGGPTQGDTTSWPVFGTPMPRNYVTVIDSVARVVEDFPSVPAMVRRAAQTVRRFPPDAELKGR
jgi:hypothetical protein